MAALVSIILKALVAWWCYSIADKQGRNACLASVLGFFFGLFAVVGYIIAGNKNPKENNSKDNHVSIEEAEIVEETEVLEVTNHPSTDACSSPAVLIGPIANQEITDIKTVSASNGDIVGINISQKET